MIADYRLADYRPRPDRLTSKDGKSFNCTSSQRVTGGVRGECWLFVAGVAWQLSTTVLTGPLRSESTSEKQNRCL